MSLRQVADLTKRILLVVLAILVVLLIAKIVVSISERLTETLTTKFSLETHGFGDLPPLTLDTVNGADKHSPDYQLETLTGELPTISRLFNVYRLKQPTIDLSSETAANNLAENLEFTTKPRRLSSIDWSWAQLDKSLEVDIQTQHFIYKNSSPKMLTNEEPASNPKGYLSSFLSRLGYIIPAGAEYEVEYLNKVGKNFVKTDNTAADWIRVSMYYSLAYNGENTARVAAPLYIPTTTYVIAPNRTGVSFENVAELAYYHWEVETENVQTYYTLTVEDAYNKLVEGAGALVYAEYTEKKGTPDVSTINTVWISDIKPGYYTSKANLLYQQPIYIFYGFAGEGQDKIDLVYYIPAI